MLYIKYDNLMTQSLEFNDWMANWQQKFTRRTQNTMSTILCPTVIESLQSTLSACYQRLLLNAEVRKDKYYYNKIREEVPFFTSFAAEL